ncbi:MAG: PAS domain S-box protein [Desulfomonile tiedjei]|nr:PAS domain S-box protein [Desulfomonile tiedjei]
MPESSRRGASKAAKTQRESQLGELKILFEKAPLGILTYSREGKIISANRFLVDLLGSPSVAATKQVNLFKFQNMIEAGISEVLAKALDSGGPQQIETLYVSKWNKRIWTKTIAFPVTDSKGNLEHGMAVVQDVTLLKQAEQQLRDSEEKFRLLTEKTPIGLAILDSSGSFEYFNPTFVAMFGYSVDEVPSLDKWMERVLDDSASMEVIQDAFLGGLEGLASPESLEPCCEAQSKDGTSKKIRFKFFPLTDGKRVVVCEDCSQLFLAWSARRISEERYLGLLEHLTDFVYTLDAKGNVLGVNRAAARSMGYEPEELVGRNIRDLIPHEVSKQIAGNLEKVTDGGFSEGLSQYLAKDGSIHYLEYRSVAIRPGDRPHYVVGMARDVTDRVLMKKKLKESEAKFEILVENAHDGITYIDEDSRLQFCNPRMKEILKDPHPEGKRLFDYYDEENRKILEEHIGLRLKGISSTYFATITDLEGTPRHMVISGTPYFDEKNNYKGAIGIYTDISELKKLEAQLQQSQKMEAIGTLAGGIAHDFNNILSGVLGYASLMRKFVGPESQLAHYVDMIEKSAERGANLAGQLLAFSRKGKRFVQSVDIHQHIDDVVDILKRTVDRKISVVTDKRAEAYTVEGDPGQIQQVLMNLSINAKDAMPKGGRLSITTEVVEIDANSSRIYKGLFPGSFLQISVEDTGEGMSPQVMERLFEPFFTTKEEGKGTGLGLSMVYGAVKSHGGIVKVYSEPGRGSVFTVLLPLKKSPETEMKLVAKKRLTCGPGTILVIDDEEIMQQLLSEMLQEMGFKVLSARDGVEGLEIYRKQWRKIDLVIVDMIMPRLSGRETFLGMKQINPSIKAILSTGFSKDGEVRDTLDQGVAGFIQKPFKTDELSDVIGTVLSLDATVE